MTGTMLFSIYFIFLVFKTADAKQGDDNGTDRSHCTTPLSSRLECSGYGTLEEECTRRGCCYDPNYVMCYFPAFCSKVLSVGGGSSAFLVVPSEDKPGAGVLSMLGNTEWCQRQSMQYHFDIDIELDLGEPSVIHLSIHHIPSHQYILPFNLTYSIHHRNLQSFIFEGGGHVPTEPVFYLSQSWYKIEARHLHLKPRDGVRSCATLTMISCPDAYVPPPKNISVMPTIYPPAPNFTALRVEVDKRASAVAMGSFGLVMMIFLLSFFVITDIPAYKRDMTKMKKNITSFIRYYWGNRMISRDRSRLITSPKHRYGATHKTNGTHSTKESVSLTKIERRKSQGFQYIDDSPTSV